MQGKIFLSLVFGVSLAAASAHAVVEVGVDYPSSANPQMTPGSLCKHPDYYRHPEHIPYCNRSVNTTTKKEIIAEYDRRFHYRIQQMDRRDFKIDHLIPLCIGGSNEMDNLWPQHVSSFVLTDPVEHKTCELVSAGRMKQKEAINAVLRAKADPDAAEAILDSLENY